MQFGGAGAGVSTASGGGWLECEARVAEDSDFAALRSLLETEDGWRLEYEKDRVKVWAEANAQTALRTVKVVAEFYDVSAESLYDVLHDPEYRAVWDTHMLAAEDAGYINVNNDVGYYAMSCPAPLKNRDFVLQRSWLDTGNEKMILNHSVCHKNFPPRKGFVRALSLLTGWIIRPGRRSGSWLGYVSRTDPRGALPAWLVNRVTAQLAPKMVHQLHAAASEYPSWKQQSQNPNQKPWLYPEQVPPHRISLLECVDPEAPTQNISDPTQTLSSRRKLPKLPILDPNNKELVNVSPESTSEFDNEETKNEETKKKGKFFKLVKNMKRSKGDGNEELVQSENGDEDVAHKIAMKFTRRFSISRKKSVDHVSTDEDIETHEVTDNNTDPDQTLSPTKKQLPDIQHEEKHGFASRLGRKLSISKGHSSENVDSEGFTNEKHKSRFRLRKLSMSRGQSVDHIELADDPNFKEKRGFKFTRRFSMSKSPDTHKQKADIHTNEACSSNSLGRGTTTDFGFNGTRVPDYDRFSMYRGLSFDQFGAVTTNVDFLEVGRLNTAISRNSSRGPSPESSSGRESVSPREKRGFKFGRRLSISRGRND